MISITTFVKDNTDDLPMLPKDFDSEAKIKKLKVVSFPSILPIIKGYDYDKGSFENKEVYKSIVDAHGLYSECFFCRVKTI